MDPYNNPISKMSSIAFPMLSSSTSGGTILYRALFQHFDRFLTEYETRFDRTRGFCPSCHAKRLEEWGEWMRMAEEDIRRIPSKGWAEMIRKVYEVDPLACPKCGGRMKVVAFIVPPHLGQTIGENQAPLIPGFFPRQTIGYIPSTDRPENKEDSREQTAFPPKFSDD